jgi:hypothetical protein
VQIPAAEETSSVADPFVQHVDVLRAKASMHLWRRVQRWLNGVHARQDEYLEVHRPDEATVRS